MEAHNAEPDLQSNVNGIEQVRDLLLFLGSTCASQQVEQRDADTKSVLFNVIDTYIQNFKTKQAFR